MLHPQIISVRRLDASRLSVACRAPFHYCTAYSDIVEVVYARDGCGMLSNCGRPYGVGSLLLTPQHVDMFVLLLRNRAQHTKDRVSRAALVALGSSPDIGADSSGGDTSSEEDGRRHSRAARRRHPASRAGVGAGARTPRGGHVHRDNAGERARDSDADHDSDGERASLLSAGRQKPGDTPAVVVAVPVE